MYNTQDIHTRAMQCLDNPEEFTCWVSACIIIDCCSCTVNSQVWKVCHGSFLSLHWLLNQASVNRVQDLSWTVKWVKTYPLSEKQGNEERAIIRLWFGFMAILHTTKEEWVDKIKTELNNKRDTWKVNWQSSSDWAVASPSRAEPN